MTQSASNIVASLRSTFATGRTRSLDWRRSQLKALHNMLSEQEARFLEALWRDLRKSKQETAATELLMVKGEIAKLSKELTHLAAPTKPPKTFISRMDGLAIQPQPLGVALIIGAWNYPIQLVLLPLAGAIAAGNCAVVKPSEIAEASAALLAELLPKYLDQDCVRVVCGGVEETQQLLEQRFDTIFYTGSSRVARIVMAAASKHLTPVTLELGGKSPVYVSHGIDLELVSRRLAWGKFMNAGQTCIAPDYVLCPPDLMQPLADALAARVIEFFGENPRDSPDYGRIVSDRMFDRLSGLLSETKAKRVVGGDPDKAERFIPPTVFVDVKPDDALMREELFGPILPILPVRGGVDEAIELINAGEKPLALYAFTNDASVRRRFEDSTSSGALVFNDVVIHAGIDTLPFGGVGESGMGCYHGVYTFQAFSHRRSVLYKNASAISEAVNSRFRYPPYNESKLGWISWALSSSVSDKGGWNSCQLL
ncbi:hypothetical protein BOX15_Mlig023123g1 [Macrostomum lignano]|uniref:Uncharacterized protein n=2 Tax=Macrostomum lignano TaxID=282301 RepID=A0A267EGB1_9PLAT|nr:hypothetical protein BOX15_Mlig023123g1 [Macrostomum lignano]